MELDLDKARAARAAEGHTITFGGVSFELPAEMSVDAGELFAAGDVRGGLTLMLNGQSEKFFELGPTVNDLDVLMNGADLDDGSHVPGLAELYVPGTPMGESSASSPSSKKGSTKPRQPSSATTAST